MCVLKTIFNHASVIIYCNEKCKKVLIKSKKVKKYGGITLLDSLPKDEEGSFLTSNVCYTLWN